MEKKPNKLIDQSSPYLLQHAYNPVQWYPWGPEALEIAKKEDKPILISIGYSACHWCHVMERESFEDVATANIMNDYFINIKIDREERPDLDQIYMDAVQAISGSGGWPLNVFLTPEGKPFFGGTYFPPTRAFNRASWSEVLVSIHKTFIGNRQEVEAKATELTSFIGREIDVSPNHLLTDLEENESLLNDEERLSIFNNLMRDADTSWGGFGKAPKFPQTFSINTLLTLYYYNKNEKALDHAKLSVDKMIEGGIYDHLGGGFSRYSTDREWLAPHFEKMLYDNALLIITISDLYKITKEEKYKDVITHTIDFIQRELKNPKGGYYAALDADSEGVEGKFYVWSYNEIHEILKNDADIFCKFYDVSTEGNWEGNNILRTLYSKEQFVSSVGTNREELDTLLLRSHRLLFEQRDKRIHPTTDDKIILSWNALLISAFCKAASAFSNNSYLNNAIETFDFITKNFKIKDSDQYVHNYKDGASQIPAFLDDYSFLITAATNLQEVTSEHKYLLFAKNMTNYVLDNFSSDGLFYYTHKDQDDIIIRKKEMYDGAIPSANATMFKNLLYLSEIFDIKEWRQMVLSNLLKFKKLSISYPSSFGNWNIILLLLEKGFKEVIVTGSEFQAYRKEILKIFLPDVLLIATNDKSINNIPLIYNRMEKNNKTVMYICRNSACLAPIHNLEEAINAVSE